MARAGRFTRLRRLFPSPDRWRCSGWRPLGCSAAGGVAAGDFGWDGGWHVVICPAGGAEGTESGENLKMKRARFVLPLALCAFGSCCALGDEVILLPTKDNTIS